MIGKRRTVAAVKAGFTKMIDVLEEIEDREEKVINLAKDELVLATAEMRAANRFKEKLQELIGEQI